MGNVNMEARQIHFRGGNKPMSVEEAIKEAGKDIPIASAETLGGIKVGENLTIDPETGILSGAAGGLHTYSTEEQEIGTWIDGKTIYERTYILRENGVDKFVKGGYQGYEYLIGLTGCEKVWIRNLCSDRTDSTAVLSDSRNLSNEIITSFDLTTGGVFVYNSHSPANVFVVLDYIKSETP